MEKSEIARILRESAGYIRGGFAKFSRHTGDGKCCALGAIENTLAGERLEAGDYRAYSDGISASSHPVTVHLAEQIQKAGVAVDSQYASSRQCGRASSWVADWNNYKDRTAKEIAGTMECLADDLDPGKT